MKMLGWLYFAIVQVISLIAMVIGWFLLIPFAALKLWKVRESKEYPGRMIEAWRGGFLTYVFGNEEDGVIGAYFYRQKHHNERLCAYLWSAWRNSANNLRFILGWKGGRLSAGRLGAGTSRRAFIRMGSQFFRLVRLNRSCRRYE